MRSLRTGALALLGALAISMMGSTALAQRFVPMRYDLRSRQARYGGNPYTTYRNYNPYAAPYRGYAGYGGYYSAYGSAAQSDPYSFEALQQRNYFVTGNVRGQVLPGNRAVPGLRQPIVDRPAVAQAERFPAR